MEITPEIIRRKLRAEGVPIYKLRAALGLSETATYYQLRGEKPLDPRLACWPTLERAIEKARGIPDALKGRPKTTVATGSKHLLPPWMICATCQAETPKKLNPPKTYTRAAGLCPVHYREKYGREWNERRA